MAATISTSFSVSLGAYTNSAAATTAAPVTTAGAAASEEVGVKTAAASLGTQTSNKEKAEVTALISAMSKATLSLSSASGVASTAASKATTKAKFTVHKYSDLTEAQKQAALKAITEINENTSTTNGATNWSEYTPKIIEELINPEDQETLFLASMDEEFVGYCCCYTNSETEIYCCWTAVAEKARRLGISLALKMEIFNSNPKVTTFTGQVKADNIANIEVIKKFGKLGYTISITPESSTNNFYTVKRPNVATK